MKYEPVIGLEIHLQIKTKSKMFCRCSNQYFNEPPNTHVCEVCFGLPGALPRPNKAAIEKAAKLALALNCEITKNTKFDRKNYFYPDIPKGYQISQFDKPIGTNGYVEIEVGDDSRRIRIHRLHVEEDTAKSLHSDSGKTLVDFNKSGVSLIEMVTEPDFKEKEEVLAFGRRLRQIVRYTDTSDAEMQKGQMRFELNISLKPAGQKELPDYKIEVKNIGSISVLEKVIDSEMERQSKILDAGETPPQETRGLKDMSGATISLRVKEGAADYRYFPEPDIAPITIEKTLIDDAEKNMPELPLERKTRYINLGLEFEQADIFVEDTERGNLYDEVLKIYADSGETLENFEKDVANWINSDLMGLLIKRNIKIKDNPVKATDLIYLIKMINDKKITGSIGKSVLEEIIKFGGTAEEIIKEKNLIQIDDDSEIDSFINQVISDNKKVVDDIAKNPNAVKFLVGQVMRISKGRVNPNVAEEKLKGSLGI